MSFDSKERAWEDSQLNAELSREDEAEDYAEELEQEVKDMLAASFADIRDEVLAMFFENMAQEKFFACQTPSELIAEFTFQVDDALYACARARIAKRNAALRAENTCPISIPFPFITPNKVTTALDVLDAAVDAQNAQQTPKKEG